MTTTDDRPAVPDREIREWAKATGKTVTERGAVGAALRAEYLAEVAAMGGSLDAGAPAAPPPGGGAETAAKPPRAARQETRPRRVDPPRSGWASRARAWFNGATTTTDSKGKAKTTPKPQADRPRTPITRLADTVWSNAARAMEHVNIPVARTMAWQSAYVGIVADDVIAHTPVDKFLQPLARAQGTLQGVGAMIAMPFIVAGITSEKSDPNLHGLPAVVRLQFLEAALDDCIDSQLEMFGDRALAGKIAKSAADRDKRAREVEDIKGMIFASMPPAPVIPEDATEAQVQAAHAEAERNERAEADLRAAVAAIKYMPPPPAEPDMRGQAAEAAAAAMAASGNAAAAAQAAASAAAARAMSAS